MKIGLPKEIKDNEYRVGLTPAGVNALVNAGHSLFVQKSAGEGSGFTDEQYVKAGGKIVDTADDAWGEGDMVVKVKEPIAPEYPRMRENQLLFTYLHLEMSIWEELSVRPRSKTRQTDAKALNSAPSLIQVRLILHSQWRGKTSLENYGRSDTWSLKRQINRR